MKYSHIVWTTYLTWQPHDKRGDWQDLAHLYQSLNDNLKIHFSKPLHESYNNFQQRNQILLSKADQITIKESILDLIANDRVARGLQISAIGIKSNEVHLLLKGSLAEEKQKLARLKSRSATLLSFTKPPTSEYKAQNTWSKGFWAAEFNEHEDIFKIKAYINFIAA